MNKKEIKFGGASLAYISPNLQKATKYAVGVYNVNLRRLNFYFFDVKEDWIMDKEDSLCTSIVTFYATFKENNEIIDIGSWSVSIDDDNEFKITRLGKHKQLTILNTEHMEVEVNQHVPVPNTLTLQFVEKNCPSSCNKKYYILLLTDRVTGNQYLELLQTTTLTITSCILLKSRQKYQYQLYKVHQQNKQFTVTHECRSTSIVTHNTQAKVEDLMNLAEKHLNRIGSNRANVLHLYRNKPTSHSTIQKAYETGIMEKYLKDNNGDPALSINNKIKGLFFMANPKTTSGKIPDESYFGNYRIMIPPLHLVEGCNLYFADFTCLSGKSHYITLVLTKINSEEDQYCHNRLVKLDFSDNPFFYKEYDRFFVPHRPYLHIEILYTESVNVVKLEKSRTYESLDFRQYILPSYLVRGRGQSKSEGIPKPSQCKVCNLSPILPY